MSATKTVNLVERQDEIVRFYVTHRGVNKFTEKVELVIEGWNPLPQHDVLVEFIDEYSSHKNENFDNTIWTRGAISDCIKIRKVRDGEIARHKAKQRRDAIARQREKEMEELQARQWPVQRSARAAALRPERSN